MTTSPRRRSAAGLGALALTAALALAACTPGSNNAPEETPTEGTSEPAEVRTDISDVGDVTLTVWDQEVRGGQNEQIEQLNEQFMETYPNVEIDRQTQSTDDLNATLRLALSGEDAPDVTQVNNSRSQMGQYVASGQLLALDDYAEAYGWTDRFSESVLQNSRYSPDGVTFGEGSIYGLPQVGEVVGVYYNQTKLDEIGLDLPQTWAEFEDQLATIEEAGETPLMLGNLDQWPALHVFGPVQGAYVPAAEIRDLGFGNAGATWTDDANVQAATTLREWVDSGYFNDGFNGADYDAVWQSFTEGQGVYLMAGSWLAADIHAAMGEDAGFFAPPPTEEGAGPTTTGATGIPFAVTSQTEHPDVAAAYIDFITSEEAMGVIAETGNMPVVETSQHEAPDPLNADVYEAYDSAVSEGELLPYLDWATPTMGETLGQALQALMGGEMDAEEFTQTVQADYAEFVASNQ
ncbi:extracellular solute-binding protein [Georgenia halophila]|uniref:Extracellular solute-binding protein n=1 Tax=Georgenia halophila TaxID=620889 RepID=A0ABP8LJE6_9MICO